MCVLWPLWSVKTKVYCQVGTKVTVSTNWLRLFSVVNCTNLFILAEWAAPWSYSGALAMSFAGDNTTTVKEKWTCFAAVIQVHPIRRPPFVPAAPFPAPLTVVWYCRGLGQWLFPDECFGKQGAFSMLSRPNGFQRLQAMSEHDQSCFVHWLWVTVLGVHQYSPMLEILHVIWVNAEAEWVLCDGDDPWSLSMHAMHSIYCLFLPRDAL